MIRHILIQWLFNFHWRRTTKWIIDHWISNVTTPNTEQYKSKFSKLQVLVILFVVFGISNFWSEHSPNNITCDSQVVSPIGIFVQLNHGRPVDRWYDKVLSKNAIKFISVQFRMVSKVLSEFIELSATCCRNALFFANKSSSSTLWSRKTSQAFLRSE